MLNFLSSDFKEIYYDKQFIDTINSIKIIKNEFEKASNEMYKKRKLEYDVEIKVKYDNLVNESNSRLLIARSKKELLMQQIEKKYKIDSCFTIYMKKLSTKKEGTILKKT